MESDPIFFYMDLSLALGNGISNVDKIHAKQVLFAKFQLINNFLDLQKSKFRSNVAFQIFLMLMVPNLRDALRKDVPLWEGKSRAEL